MFACSQLNTRARLSMTIYLSPLELVARVHLGKEVEQWLGAVQQEGQPILQWLCLYQEEPHQYAVTYIESYDEGDEEWQDVASFSQVEPEESPRQLFPSVEQALAFARQTYGAAPDRFVASGMIAAEYATYWRSKQP
ncbi:hypothetical protein MTX78_23975 (plasmid) [Hymenobacter tibetensis]|uniref:Uncharacterized protein n=1 Tax=Hymenobacter tibetensis TaxID=497967 RepID=A0ABY4D4N1_9BACT|nr:hypothetical protein [Hymenobacter tibetensis]UOG77405.1 hypothetical protein MTX78_23975 [Hymenobacter tibetensis]